MLVTIEGIDGAGKSTIVEHIDASDIAKGSDDVVFTREPTDSPYGELLRENLAKDTANKFTELFLFMADHADHVDSTIRPAVNSGKIVVCDRYIDSRCAYQGVTLRDEVTNPLRFIEELHGIDGCEDSWSVVPDVTVFIDISVDTAINRLDTNHKFEKKEKLQEIKQNYEALIQKHSDRFIVVDGEQTIENVTKEVIRAIRNEINVTH